MGKVKVLIKLLYSSKRKKVHILKYTEVKIVFFFIQ